MIRSVVVSRLANGLNYDVHSPGSKNCPEMAHGIRLKPQSLSHVNREGLVLARVFKRKQNVGFGSVHRLRYQPSIEVSDDKGT